MDRTQRAAAAVVLLRHANKIDSQECADFLCSVIEREQLWQCMTDDAGAPLSSMEDFRDEMDAEFNGTPRQGITADAGPSASGDRLAKVAATMREFQSLAASRR